MKNGGKNKSVAFIILFSVNSVIIYSMEKQHTGLEMMRWNK